MAIFNVNICEKPIIPYNWCLFYPCGYVCFVFYRTRTDQQRTGTVGLSCCATSLYRTYTKQRCVFLLYLFIFHFLLSWQYVISIVSFFIHVSFKIKYRTKNIQDLYFFYSSSFYFCFNLWYTLLQVHCFCYLTHFKYFFFHNKHSYL